MRAVRLRRNPIWIAGVLAACGGAPVQDLEQGRVRLTAQQDATGIHRLEVDGVNLFEGVGGYYIIGTCSGADDPGQNVISKGGDGRTLHAPGQCPGAPFNITISGDNPRRVSIRIGPLPVDYRSLSAPLDPTRSLFDTFSFSGNRYEVGCANSWRRRNGAGGRFDSIPQPCNIPVAGPVGAARVHGIGRGSWGEIAGPIARIRRTILDSNASELVFYRHPGTHNIEIGFGAHRRGETLFLEEELSVHLPGSLGAPPSTEPRPSTPSAAPLTVLYRGILGREPDPSGAATYGPRVASGARDEMKRVGRDLLASSEFRALYARIGADGFIDQLYRGFFARPVDPTGRSTWVPLLRRGEHLRVVSGLLDSAELANTLGGVGPSHPPPSQPASPQPTPTEPSEPAAPVGQRAQWLLDVLYRGIFARAPDPSGRRSFLPRLEGGTVAEAIDVARELIASGEYRTRKDQVGPDQVLADIYRGFLGREIDPTGRTTHAPIIRRGDDLRVVQDILRSVEFARRLP